MTSSVGNTRAGVGSSGMPFVLMKPSPVSVIQFPALPNTLGKNDDLPELTGLAAAIFEAMKQLRDGFPAAVQGMVEEGCKQPEHIDFTAWLNNVKKRWLDYYLNSQFFDDDWQNRVNRYALLLDSTASLLPRYRAISERFWAIEQMIGEWREEFENQIEEAVATIWERAGTQSDISRHRQSEE